MSRRYPRWLCLLLLGVLAACATAQPVGNELAEDEDEGAPLSFEAACAEHSSVLALCAGNQCGVFRCREVIRQLTVGQVVRTWGEVEPLAEAGIGVQRYWGSAQEWPWESRPVFIIPWNSKPPLLPSQQKLLEEQAEERRKPHERHHIFPQALRQWFTDRGIDIDEYVIPLEVEKHRSIHRGANGGPWNEAWRQFIKDHQAGEVTKAEIYRYAGQLIYEFQLFGPVIPYWKQPPPLPSGY